MSDNIRQFNDRHKNPPQDSQIASTKFIITGMANLRPLFSEEVLQEVVKNSLPLTLAKDQPADPSLVQTLTQIQQLMQKPHYQLISVTCYQKNILMVWTLEWPQIIGQFEEFEVFQSCQGSNNMLDEFKNMFALTLTDIAWNWFEPKVNNTHDIPTLKEKIIKRFYL